MKKSIFYALLICCLALGGCSEQLEADVFGLSAHAADFTAEGGEKNIVMNTACDCELSCSDIWVTLSAQYIETGRSELTITAEPNPTFDSRQTIVAIVNDEFGVSGQIAVRQAGIVPCIDCDTTLDTTFEGGTFQIEVSSTIPWEASTDADWLTLSPATGQAGMSILTVEIPSLLSDASRHSEIVLTNTEHKVTKKIKVNQNGLSQTEKARTITYTTDDNNPISKSDFDSAFDATIIAHIFDSGTGMLIFDKPITCIGYHAFYNCGNLKSITIPNSVTSIGNSAFSNSGLESITIPNSITAIGYSAFSSCRYLTSITIPDSVTEIGEGAFWDSHLLTAFYGKFASSDNKCLIVDGVLIAFAPMETGTIAGIPYYYLRESYTIPDSVTAIESSAFYGNGLESITIPDSVTAISSAFWGCISLTNIYCKPTIPPIELGYFSEYSGQIEYWGTIFLPSSVQKIYVPRASVEAYKNAAYWKEYASIIVGYDF